MPLYKLKSVAIILAVFLLVSSGCGTIFGGSKYNAFVKVNDKPNAKIYYKGTLLGAGSGNLKIERKDANKLSFKVSQEGCPDQQFNYTTRGFRGWAFTGSLFSSLFITFNNVPIIVPVIIDFINGSLYKPEQSDPSIRKVNYKNYYYNLDYTLCNIGMPAVASPNAIQLQPNAPFQSKEEKLMELKELFDAGMISEEEYKSAREVVLAK